MGDGWHERSSIPPANTIGSTQLKTDTIGSQNISDFAITRNKIAYDSIGTISNVIGSFATPIGSLPSGLAYNPEKHNLWYISAQKDYIFNIGTTTHNVIGSFATPSTNTPSGLTFAADNHRLCNVCDDEYIYIIGTTTGNKIGSFRAPDPTPYGLEYDPDSHHLWYTSTNAPWNYIFQLGTKTGLPGSTGNIIGSFKGPLSTGIRGLAYVPATHRLWVAYKNNNTIFEIGTTTGNVIGSIPANLPADLTFATDKNRLWDTASNVSPVLREIYQIGTLIDYSPLRSRSVEHWNITDGAIGSTQLAKPAVGSANLYSNAVYAAKIKNNTIGSQQIANSAIIGTKIANDTIGSQKLATGAIYSVKIANDTIGSRQLANTAVTRAKIGNAAVGSIQIGKNMIGSTLIVNNTIGSQQLANNAVTQDKIANNAVGSQQLANASVIQSKIANNSVGSQQLANSAVIRSKIASGAVGSVQIDKDIIGSQNIKNSAIIGTKIANDTIGSQKLANSAVTTGKIAAASVTEPKFAQHFEAGRMGTVTVTARYYNFNTAFSAVPTVIVCGQAAAGLADGGIQLSVTPSPGSFKVNKSVTAGTVKGYYMAWGSR